MRAVLDWIASSGDNRGLAYVIVDKLNAKVFLFDAHGRLQGATSALLGLGLGDETVPGIGNRRLATISAAERTTPAGRFVASLGDDLEQDVLWIDYDAAVSLHRVIVGRPEEHRSERLRSPSTLDKRISYGCINVPAAFYDNVIIPAFRRTVGIVYILPETKSVGAVFGFSEGAAPPPRVTAHPRYPHLEDSRARADR
ncbi:MAG: hypothetical protein QOJ27_1901 [Sphingomonadales bacterium]|nr:hypothetical protein [Sphingomonadales bacterium]